MKYRSQNWYLGKYIEVNFVKISELLSIDYTSSVMHMIEVEQGKRPQNKQIITIFVFFFHPL